MITEDDVMEHPLNKKILENKVVMDGLISKRHTMF